MLLVRKVKGKHDANDDAGQRARLSNTRRSVRLITNRANDDVRLSREPNDFMSEDRSKDFDLQVLDHENDGRSVMQQKVFVVVSSLNRHNFICGITVDERDAGNMASRYAEWQNAEVRSVIADVQWTGSNVQFSFSMPKSQNTTGKTV